MHELKPLSELLPNSDFQLSSAVHSLITPSLNVNQEKMVQFSDCGLCGTTRSDVMSQCTALLSWKSEFRGGSDSGFSSCIAPTYYCRSEYFYSQHPQVQNLIGMECSLNRDEDRVKNKARVISNSLGNWSSQVQSDVRNDQRLSRQ